MSKVEVTARENGPYLVSGSSVLIDADGNATKVEGKMVALCCCGGSKTSRSVTELTERSTLRPLA